MRRIAFLVLSAVTATVTLLALTLATPVAAQTDAGSVGRGDRGETIGFWQDRLNVWFGLVGSNTRLTVDGIFGPRTEAGTLEFQRATDDLDEDGAVDQEDRVALENAIDELMEDADTATVGRGDRGETIGFWQDRLNVWFGLVSSDTRLTVDGIFGPRTEAGTLEFQRATEGLDDDGLVGPEDRLALENAIEAQQKRGRDVLVYFLDGESLAVGGRSVDTVAVANAAMRALLEGPSDGFEQDLGWTTAIPSGTTLNGVVIDDGTATVDLGGEFESGGGSASVTARVAQVVFTLTQFPTVDEVDVEIDGEPRTSLTGQGFPGQDLDRDDFLGTDLLGAPMPAILVESPYVGQSVGDTITLSGLANTFENAVSYEVTDTDGVIQIEGFLTARSDLGDWGPFVEPIELPTFDRDGVASVFVFEVSARDGSRQNLVEVPIRVTAD